MMYKPKIFLISTSKVNYNFFIINEIMKQNKIENYFVQVRFFFLFSNKSIFFSLSEKDKK